MPVIQADDKVWFDSDRKLREICDEVQTIAAENRNVLVLSHFQANLSRLERRLREQSVSYQNFTSYDSSGLCSAPFGTVRLGLARAFEPPNTLRLEPQPGARLQVLIFEHHPRQSKDQAVIDVAEKLACDSELCFYFSLDDPLLRHFNGDSIQKLFRQLGIDESECLSHHLITTAIRGAQEKIERQVPRDLQAESIEDWFKYNLPGKK